MFTHWIIDTGTFRDCRIVSIATLTTVVSSNAALVPMMRIHISLRSSGSSPVVLFALAMLSRAPR